MDYESKVLIGLIIFVWAVFFGALALAVRLGL